MPAAASPTKTEMARVIVAALYRMPGLPAETDTRVKNLARRKKVDLEVSHKLALSIINRGIAEGTWPEAQS